MSGADIDLTWLDRLDPSGTTVASYVLSPHRAVVRILNPAHVDQGRSISWRDVGGDSFRPLSDFQWPDLDLRAKSNIEEPAMGTVDDAVTAALLRHLAPDDTMIVVAQWEGYADVCVDENAPRVVFPPDRPCLVRRVPARSLLDEQRKPMRWRDPDLAWMAANDIYARSIFVSGTEHLIESLIADPALEAIRVTFNDRVTPEDRTRSFGR